MTHYSKSHFFKTEKLLYFYIFSFLLNYIQMYVKKKKKKKSVIKK